MQKVRGYALPEWSAGGVELSGVGGTGLLRWPPLQPLGHRERETDMVAEAMLERNSCYTFASVNSSFSLLLRFVPAVHGEADPLRIISNIQETRIF